MVRFNMPDISWALDRLESILRQVEQEDEQIQRAKAILARNGWPIPESAASEPPRIYATPRQNTTTKKKSP